MDLFFLVCYKSIAGENAQNKSNIIGFVVILGTLKHEFVPSSIPSFNEVSSSKTEEEETSPEYLTALKKAQGYYLLVKEISD